MIVNWRSIDLHYPIKGKIIWIINQNYFHKQNNFSFSRGHQTELAELAIYFRSKKLSGVEGERTFLALSSNSAEQL